jgi:hypothetical protein
MQTIISFPCDIWIITNGGYPREAYLNKDAAKRKQHKINGDRAASDPGYCNLMQTNLYATDYPEDVS